MMPTARDVYGFWLAMYYCRGYSWEYSDKAARTNVERWKLGWL